MSTSSARFGNAIDDGAALRVEPLRATRAVERREVVAGRKAERIRRPVGGGDERGRGLGEQAHVGGDDARKVGVDDDDRPLHAGERRGDGGALPLSRIGDELDVHELLERVRVGRDDAHRARPEMHAATTSPNIALASAPRTSGDSCRRVFPAAPANGITIVGMWRH